MEKQKTKEKESGQMKTLLIRVWEILRGVGKDRPLSVEDIREILMEQDRAAGIGEDDANKEKYNLRLLRANIKAINDALENPPPNFNVTKQNDSQRAERLQTKMRGERAKGHSQEIATDRIEKCFVGRRADKECLYYHKDALTGEELRFLFDAVQSASFLSADAADALCRKLTKLCGGVDKQVWSERVVAKKDKQPLAFRVFDTVRTIEQAIERKKRLHIIYCKGYGKACNFEWDNESMDPIAVLYNNGYYYVYGYSHLTNKYCVLRVDRIRKAKITDEDSVHTEERASFLGKKGGKDILFASQMGAADPTEVMFRVPGGLVLDMFDKFGAELQMIDEHTGHFAFRKKINLSPEFLGWCASYNGDVEILAPPSARLEFAKFVLTTQKYFETDYLIFARSKIKNT